MRQLTPAQVFGEVTEEPGFSDVAGVHAWRQMGNQKHASCSANAKRAEELFRFCIAYKCTHTHASHAFISAKTNQVNMPQTVNTWLELVKQQFHMATLLHTSHHGDQL